MRGMNRRNNRSSEPPVNVGEELDVTIDSIGEKGDGIAKVKGFVLFVGSVKQGERCRVRITKVLQRVGFADKIGEAHTEEDEQEKAPAPLPEPEPSPEDSESFGEEEGEGENNPFDLGLQ